MVDFPWIMQMEWRDLVFLHWPLPAASLTPFLPGRVPLDLWQGEAWLGLVTFDVTGFRPRGVPFALDFAQVNLRTYVRVNGGAGIWTFSLDAANALAVLGARLGFCLPYFTARASLRPEGDALAFQSVRRRHPACRCRLHYRPTGEVFRAQPGTLEHWLTERRSLFTVGWGGALWREDVQHEAWPLQAAEVQVVDCTLPGQLGLGALGSPLAHYARVVHVKGWPPRSVKRG
ncbi:DUF2071 domain-containing protein [Deinococcus metallilatus]|uniref:DUF2071 domain-containing protein n=1 Tax=Deinococcus metallilatus TaxID=1211322 RepID=A0AAJ5F3S5_9DEIO|nr:DUF2071 domain-containing protein [Deinococcus metallilatus]MBB5295948.1 hypothetical protein [Deinococcus metallilatus]QBY08223.1 DUF2071 domain-containing protein [Deinococcus metallilatus]RXJ11954.1 DUF2071 domain-containing protein [Deinococcus metallilatus]TLK25814.1 DUF2071 domain-containing protein [Deinococcus metallilatus]GMA14517.1 hypothetical protein GCM10025871_08480 [Deinococcus metallilatus]